VSRLPTPKEFNAELDRLRVRVEETRVLLTRLRDIDVEALTPNERRDYNDSLRILGRGARKAATAMKQAMAILSDPAFGEGPIRKVVCQSANCNFCLAEARGGHVLFGPGWVNVDGRWKMSRRAYRRLQEGRRPAFRRAPPRPNQRRRVPDAFYSRGVLPVSVECPACGRLRTVDAVLESEHVVMPGDGKGPG
jgi:hypothetical protein